ncbi:MAG: hypothetical protein ISN29_08825 [Gammaproteobacteria bacterium AqS3]|nr:hypothetical protein [Gammaproteobacteria bacterium AqS3]
MTALILLICAAVLAVPLMLNYRDMHQRGRIIAASALLAVPALGAGLYLAGDSWRQQAAYDRLSEAGALNDVGTADADLRDYIAALVADQPERSGFRLWLLRELLNANDLPAALVHLDELVERFPQDQKLLTERLLIHIAVHGRSKPLPERLPAKLADLPEVLAEMEAEKQAGEAEGESETDSKQFENTPSP